MKINKLVACDFGKLRDVSISLDDKVTVITGKNEAGKSSVASFIKYMLYGFSSSRSGNLSENDKKKYMPWDGESCSGEMYFTCADGKSYRAARKTAQRNQSGVFDFEGQPTNITEAGEHFLGVDENCFKKTAFIGESDVSFSDSGAIDEAIRNIVFSADEGVDSAKAMKKLDTLRKFYLGKTGRSGELYNLECEIRDLEEKRIKWQNGHKELMSAEYNLGETSAKIAFNAEKKRALEKELENLEAYKAKKQLEELDKLKNAVAQSKKSFEEHFSLMQNGSFVPDEVFKDDLEKLLNEINDTKLKLSEASKDVESARLGMESVYTDNRQKRISDGIRDGGHSCESLLNELKELQGKAKKYLILALVFTLLLVTFPIGIVFFIKRSKTLKEIQDICRGCGCENDSELESRLSSVESFRNLEKSAKDILKNAAEKNLHLEEVLAEKMSLLEKTAQSWGYESTCDIKDRELLLRSCTEYLERLKTWLDTLSKLKAKCNDAFVAYKTLASSVDANKLHDTANGFNESLQVRDEAVIRRELSFYTQANEALTVKERELEKTAAVLAGTLPKPGEIQSRIISLSARRDEMRKKHDALNLALESLEKAAESMKKEASPLIAKESGELFCGITGGKYNGLFTDSEMNLSFLESGAPVTRDSGYLSTGTRDAAYISLRIALCKFLYKENPVLVFDDAFSHMDDERLKNTLSYLEALSDEFQIVILSCHNREKEFFAGKAKIIDFEIG